MNKMKVKTLFVVLLLAGFLGSCQGNQKKQEQTDSQSNEIVLAGTENTVLAGTENTVLAGTENTVLAGTENTMAPEEKDIPFTIAERYFVKNTVKSIDNPKITTKEDFDRLFGMAAVMGENGLPTEIDFTKQFVIAVAIPPTDYATQLIPVSLQSNDKNEIVLSYKIETGEKRLSEVRPGLIIIVDKGVTGNVVLNEVR